MNKETWCFIKIKSTVKNIFLASEADVDHGPWGAVTNLAESLTCSDATFLPKIERLKLWQLTQKLR